MYNLERRSIVVHIAEKFEESGYTWECKPHDSLEVDLKPP